MNSAELAKIIKTIFMLRIKSHDLNATVIGHESGGALPLQFVSLPARDNLTVIHQLRRITQKLYGLPVEPLEDEEAKTPANGQVPIIHNFDMKINLLNPHIEANAKTILHKQLQHADAIAEKTAKKLIAELGSTYPGTHLVTDLMEGLAKSSRLKTGRKTLSSLITLLDKQTTPIEKLEGIFTIALKAFAPESKFERHVRDGKNLKLEIKHWPKDAHWQDAANYIAVQVQLAKSDGITHKMGIGHPPILTINIDAADDAAQAFAKNHLPRIERNAKKFGMIPSHLTPEPIIQNIKDAYPAIDMGTRILQKMAEQLGKKAVEHIRHLEKRTEDPAKIAKLSHAAERIEKCTARLSAIIGKQVKDPELHR